MMKKNCENLKDLDWKCNTSLLNWNVYVYGDKRFEIAIFVLSPLVFFCFEKIWHLAIVLALVVSGWLLIGMSWSWTCYKIFLNKYFGEMLKWNGV